jgi:hypothetical protein
MMSIDLGGPEIEITPGAAPYTILTLTLRTDFNRDTTFFFKKVRVRIDPGVVADRYCEGRPVHIHFLS